MKKYFDSLVCGKSRKEWRDGVTNGKKYAYRAWRSHGSTAAGEIEMDSQTAPDPCDVTDFLCALRNAGASALIVTDRSSGLMALIHTLIANGAEFTGPCVLEREPDCFGRVETVQGLRFLLNA